MQKNKKIIYFIVVILVTVVIIGSNQRNSVSQSFDSELVDLPDIIASGRVDARGEKHYFLSSGTTNGSVNGYSGLDSFCENDSNAISGRNYHAYATNATGRGFLDNYIYTNSTYGTFVLTGSQSPDFCGAIGINCHNKWSSNAPSEYIWNTASPACDSWTTSSNNTGNVIYQPFRTSMNVGETPVSAGNTWYCGDQRKIICIENTVAISNDVVAEPFYVSSSRNWSQAVSYCQNEGAHLAYIGDEATNTAVKDLAGGNSVWIGYNDISQEGNWDWEGGFAEIYTNWGSGEPNDSGGEDCTEMYNTGLWNDSRCNAVRTFVCSYQ